MNVGQSVVVGRHQLLHARAHPLGKVKKPVAVRHVQLMSESEGASLLHAIREKPEFVMSARHVLPVTSRVAVPPHSSTPQ